MSFSRPGQLLVSRSFYEVVSCLSRDYKALFRHEGQRTDKHVREHEVYAVVGGTPSAAARRADRVADDRSAERRRLVRGRRSTRRAAFRARLRPGGISFALIGSGVAARSVMDPADRRRRSSRLPRPG